MGLFVIALASQKGGAGKTTLAAHLAVAAQIAGAGPVVVIDTDPQGTLSKWWNRRESEDIAFAQFPLTALERGLAGLDGQGFRLAIIDTPPAVTASIRSVIERADLVLVPVKPSPNDLEAVGATVELIERSGKAFAFVANEARRAAAITATAIATLSEFGRVVPVLVGDRVGFPEAMISGRTIQEIARRSPGAGEVAGLWDFVAGQMAGAKKGRKAAHG